MLKTILPAGDIPAGIIAAAGGNAAAAAILYNRGFISAGAIRDFLDHQGYAPTLPRDIPGLLRAAEAAARQIRAGVKVCVYGDYDVDGVTSTALLAEALGLAGAQAAWHVPDRFTEGYGLNEGVIRRLADTGVGLIITCDCGISAAAEIALAAELGISVVVTDHHEAPEVLPPALALVNPKFLPPGHPGRMLPGVGAAFLFARGLLDYLGVGYSPDTWLDLLALGIVADCVPILDDNRYWLKKGLPALRQTRRPGLSALIKSAGVDPACLTEEDIAFQLAPRLNACGRLDSAARAVNLLTESDPARAAALAGELGRLNQRRKELVQEIQEEAGALLKGPLPPALALYRPSWHEGVIGIAAGRLCEEYHRPALLMARRADGAVVGSARSVEGVNIYEILNRCSGLLLRFGGHDAAAGFSLLEENVPLLIDRVQGETRAATRGVSPEKSINVDLVIEAGGITRQLYDEIQSLAPFGEAFPPPVLLTRDLTVFSSRPTAGGQHLQLLLGLGDNRFKSIYWNSAEKKMPPAGDFIYSLSLNRWNGRENLQLVIAGLTPAKAAPPPEVEVLDRRAGRDLPKLAREFPGAAFYAEDPGRDPACGAGRHELNPSATLVLLSIPPGPKILRELVAAVNPVRVILAFGKPEPSSLNTFYTRLLGLAKHAVVQKSGLLSVSRAASAIGEAEAPLLYGFRRLAATGHLELEEVDDDLVRVSKGSGKQPAPANSWHEKVVIMISEANAFRRYLGAAAAADIQRLINSQLR